MKEDETVAFIRLGYQVAMKFTASVDNFKQFSEAVKAIGGYNNFEPENVIRELAPLWDELSEVEVGREYSPVIYVHLPFWHGQSFGNKGKDKSSDMFVDMLEMQTLKSKVIAAFERAKADELPPIGGDSPDRIRAWWD